MLSAPSNEVSGSARYWEEINLSVRRALYEHVSTERGRERITNRFSSANIGGIVNTI